MRNLLNNHMVFPKKETMSIVNACLIHFLANDPDHIESFLPIHLNKDDTQNFPALDFLRMFLNGNFVRIECGITDKRIVTDKSGKYQDIDRDLVGSAIYFTIRQNRVEVMKSLLETSFACICDYCFKFNLVTSLEIFKLFCDKIDDSKGAILSSIDVVTTDIEMDTEKKAEKISLLSPSLRYRVFANSVFNIPSKLKQRIQLFYGEVRTIEYLSDHSVLNCDRGSFDINNSTLMCTDIKKLFPTAVEIFHNINIQLKTTWAGGLKF
jgi:hypothetical protein